MIKSSEKNKVIHLLKVDFYCNLFKSLGEPKKGEQLFLRGGSHLSWLVLFDSNFFVFGPIELIFSYDGANVC